MFPIRPHISLMVHFQNQIVINSLQKSTAGYWLIECKSHLHPTTSCKLPLKCRWPLERLLSWLKGGHPLRPVRDRNSRTFIPQLLLVLRAAHCHFHLLIPRAISVILILLRIFALRILLRIVKLWVYLLSFKRIQPEAHFSNCNLIDF